MRLTPIVLTACLVLPVLAQDSGDSLSVRGDFTGNWTDPVPNRQGVQIQVVDARRAVIAWLTYNTFGDPVWLVGTGEIEGRSITAEMLRFAGGTFPPADSQPDAITGETWGQVFVVFDDCNSGTMRWAPSATGFDAGEMPLVRIIPIEGLRCGQAEIFEQTVQYSFDAGPGRWRAAFADFTAALREGIEAETEAEWTDLPAPLSDRRGFKLAGTNRSADLAMMMFAPIGGLAPETDYRLEFDLTFATDVPKGCVGAGSSPGEGVTVKVGASAVEPALVERDNNFEFNIDKGNQSADGPDAVSVGDLTNSQDCEIHGVPGTWELKTVSSRNREFIARTDEAGRMWIYALSDSGFEGRTTFFVTDFVLRLRRL